MGQKTYYPLVNVYITMERSTMLFMGKRKTISTGPFSIANCKHLPEGIIAILLPYDWGNKQPAFFPAMT